MSELKHELPNCEKCGNQIRKLDFDGVSLLCGNCYDKQNEKSITFLDGKEYTSTPSGLKLKEKSKEFGVKDMEKKLQVNMPKTVTTTEQVVMLKEKVKSLEIKLDSVESKVNMLINAQLGLEKKDDA